MCQHYKHFISENINPTSVCIKQTITKVEGGYNVHEEMDTFVSQAQMDGEVSGATERVSALTQADLSTEIATCQNFADVVNNIE